MSDSNGVPNPFGFMMPGLDAMRQWSGMSASPASPPGWTMPTLSVEDLEKRIQELKTVQYWLEQNARMIGATIQALEVQKMTLSTLKTMNVHADELAKAMKVQPQDLMSAWVKPGASAQDAATSVNTPKREPEEESLPSEEPFDAPPDEANAAPQNEGVDPVQWWGALNQQFQDIASSAARDWQHHAERAQKQMAAAKENAAQAAKTGAPVARKKSEAKPAAKVARKRATSKATKPRSGRAA